MDTPLVSVLMTSYNREKYIAEAIESLLRSTYQNFELIIVDDRSKDRTAEIAKEYEQKDDRIKVFLNEKNLGQFPNRNYAASLAKGKYLKYLDSDDLIYPGGLSTLVEMMEKFPDAGYGLCSLDQDVNKIFPFSITPKEAYERHFCKGIPLFHKAPLSSIIRVDAFKAVNGFTNNSGEGDYEMWLSLSQKQNVVLMPHGIVWYRQHDEQIDFERRNNPIPVFKYFIVTLKYLESKDCPLDQVQRDKLKKEKNIQMVKMIIKSFFKYSPKVAGEMYYLANYSFSDFMKISLQAIKK